MCFSYLLLLIGSTNLHIYRITEETTGEECYLKPMADCRIARLREERIRVVALQDAMSRGGGVDQPPRGSSGRRVFHTFNEELVPSSSYNESALSYPDYESDEKIQLSSLSRTVCSRA